MKIKQTTEKEITWERLKEIAVSGEADKHLAPFDEIGITLEGGEAVTVVVAGFLQAAEGLPAGVRFMFKDGLDDPHRMNDDWTNAGGYKASEGRRHILEDVYPRLPADLRAVIRPRKITEDIKEGVLVYEDPLWLPSETDLFGHGSERLQRKNVDGPDDFQLPIFLTERDRVKLRKDYGTTPYWTRSVNSGYSNGFCLVNTDGTANRTTAYNSYALAPGFDL